MNDRSQSQSGKATDELSLEVAAQWWLRLRSAQDPEVATEWLKWSSEAAQHADAFERVAKLGNQLDLLDEQAKGSLVDEFVPRKFAPRARRFLRPPLFAAAAAVFAVAILAGGYFTWLESSHVTEQVFTTQVGENRNLTLADGSQVALGGASEIEVRYGKRLREILLKKGEAYFADTHEPGRPFVVIAGKLSTRAIGTAFDVRRAGGTVAVGVAEGRVLVAKKDTKASSHYAVEAFAGQQVLYRPSAAGLVVRDIDPGKVAAWREHRFEFMDEPLSGVIAQLDRYSQRPLRIEDSSLNALKFTGTVNLDNLDGWLHALPVIFPVKVTFRNHVILLSSAKAHQKRD